MKYNLLFALGLLSFVSYGQDYSSNETTSSVTDTVKNKKGEILNEVVVTKTKEPKPVTAVRSGLKPMDNPQSIQVIGSDVIEQQQAIRLSEVLKNANGVYVSSARGGAQESFFSRGYDMSANNMFKNGFRYNSGSIPDVSGLEKVEFLKGGSALLFGNVAPGGILNLVTKTPQFKSGGEISMQMGSYSYYKPAFDFYGGLNKSIAFRINGSYENSESYRDVVKNERLYINPSLLFVINPKTQITVQGDYLSADWTPDFGTGIIGKEILDLPRNAFYGALWSNGTTKSSSASVLLNHDFNKNWKLNFNSSYQTYNRTQKSTAQLSNLDDTKIYPIPGYWNRGLTQGQNLEQILGDQLSLQGNFNTGSVKHQIFTGVDWENSFATAYTYAFSEEKVKVNGKYDPSLYDTIYLYDFDPSTQRNDIPNARATQITKTDTNRFGVYFQDFVSITDKFKVLAGLRWSWQEAEVSTYKETKTGAGNPEDAVPTVTPKRLDNAFSPKAGLVYQPTKDISVFGSYSTSFTPNTGTTVDLQPLEASIIDQYEVGVKTDFFKGLLSTNVTVYQITNSNFAQMAPYKADGSENNDSSIKLLSGETKSKGVEVDVTARPVEGLNIIAGYSYNDMRYTKTSGLNGSFIEGDRVARTPSNTANLSFFYTLQEGFFKGVSVGAIGNYIGDRIGGWNNQYDSKKPDGIWYREIPLEGYVTIDASVGYTWRKFSILCKLSNITNELNYTVHENYSVNPIAPRQVMTSLRYKF
ncbi:TonB-dependent siderophore receptor [Flavobacterium nitrogenifigens]|uniref:Iron complex outermembrane recepter protein n=1 Tax=Flavobacterium nitrogenifigens TaxID=1617283 RepID=A0A521ALA1_9FLAO|nr:TonB-dependent siderophore receptor [Flavobacterium nitrogenifigens]KAF2331638.1 TonB-dependent siderophore receptor [Flavobacterium nitrogenifigens]SMO35430.1 iron complex outermembrane recepter protein [Flavobacterium nitrogenifigens]